MKLIKIPFSGGGMGKGNGADEAPNKVVHYLENFFSNESGKIPEFQVEEIKVDEFNISESHNNIQTYIEKVHEKAILIGGDHSITYPSVKGFAKNYQDFKLVVFDAHPDMVNNFTPPTQEDYLKVLIEENIVKPENVLLVGVRNWDKLEVDYLKEKNIHYITADQVFQKGIKEVTKLIQDFIDKPTYLSIDIDVVDPVEAIGTGYIEHGGLSSRELLFCLQNIKQTNIQMIDIVEINPSKDMKDMTSILGSKLIVELFDF